MRRWTLKAGATDLEGLVLGEAPTPEPGMGQVRVRVQAASLNYRDHLVLTDPKTWRTDKEIIAAADSAGEIDAIGPGVTQWVVGDRVVTLYFRNWISGPPHADMGYGLGSLDEDGVLAEYVVLPAGRVTRAPASLNSIQASTLPCAALTAWSTLMGAYPIAEGSKVLVLGTGGVSLFALVIAHALGAEVFATTSQESKRAKLLVP